MAVKSHSLSNPVYDLGVKILELGNLLLLGFVVSQSIPGLARFNWPIAVAGFVMFALAYMLGFRLMKGGGR